MGVDESGRGPLAGPLVAACVFLGKENFGYQVNDSKSISPSLRLKSFFEIIDSSLVSVGIVYQGIIDQINIYKATRIAMRDAVLGLGIKPDYVLVDGPIKIDIPFPQKSVIKGDRRSLSIAAASIVAKVVRDTIMYKFDKEYPQYGFKEHKGYPTPRHIRALFKYGPCAIHRLSFKPVSNICHRTKYKYIGKIEFN